MIVDISIACKVKFDRHWHMGLFYCGLDSKLRNIDIFTEL